jgi:hypothetical protein
MGAPYNLFPAGKRTFKYVATGAVVTGWPRPHCFKIPGLDVLAFSFNGQTLRLADGTYLCTLYGQFEGENGEAIVAGESKDGVHWTVRSLIADRSCQVPGAGGPSESAICRLKDGRIMCVFRVESHMPFGQTWSSDEGKTWTPATQMSVPFSVQPSLAVMADGTVALSGGRPGLYLWLNPDGTGRDWLGVDEGQAIDLVAHHNECHPAEPISPAKDLVGKRTTAYTEVVAVDETHLLYMYDRTPNGWERIPEDMDDRNSV